MGLLDSGATSTVVGGPGLATLLKLGLKSKPLRDDTYVRVADSNVHTVQEEMELPIVLNGEQKNILAYVVPSLTQSLYLGMDFWHAWRIVPDVLVGRWTTSPKPTPELSEVRVIQPKGELTIDEQNRLGLVINEYAVQAAKGLGRTTLVQHRIDTGQADPVKQRYYPVSPVIQCKLNEELDKMLQLGVVEPSSSPWSSPVLLVKKPSGENRLCLDSRVLNAVTKRDAYPLPYVANILDKLRNARFLSSIDLKSAFWQIPLEAESKERTAFTVPGRGLFHFNVLPFGLHNAAQTQQRLMDRVLGPALEPKVFVYLDDIIIVTGTFEEHVEILLEVLKRLNAAGLTVNANKCEFCRPSLHYLGFVVDKEGLRTSPEKIAAIQKYPKPSTITEMKRFLGVASWYRRFIENYATVCAPLHELTKRTKNKSGKVDSKIVWTETADNAFQEIKKRLVTAPVLACPDYEQTFTIQTDASDKGIGAVLTQGEGSDEQPIAYISRKLNKAEMNYSVTEKECLAVVFAVEKLRPYVEGVPFKVVTDHYSLLWLNQLKDPHGKLARWAVKLQQFDFTLSHRKGKDHVVPDALSRAAIDAIEIHEEEHDAWYGRLLREVERSPGEYPAWRREGDKLYKYIEENYGNPGDLHHWKLAVPKGARKRVLQEGHDDPKAAHLGIFKTKKRIQRLYYWPKMTSDIATYVRKCNVCLQYKTDPQPRSGLMGKQKAVSRPWQLISTDFLGPFPRSSKGNTFLLVVSDWFTKYSLLFPLRAATASSVIRVLEEEIFLVYGVPQYIVCDNGSQFISKALLKIARDYRVNKVWYNARYHPQTNPTERVNRVLVTAIASYVKDNHRTWDVNIAKIGCAIRSATHEVTKKTPNFLTFGRENIISGDEYGTPVAEPEDLVVAVREEKSSRSQEMQAIFEDVQARLKKAYDRNARTYNLRKRPVEFQEGQYVWKRNYTLSSAPNFYAAKLSPKYIKCIVKKKLEFGIQPDSTQ